MRWHIIIVGPLQDSFPAYIRTTQELSAVPEKTRILIHAPLADNLQQ